MEKNLKIFLIVLAAAAVLLIVSAVASYFSKGRRKGRAAEKKVAKLISKLGKKDNIRIINNAFLPLYKKTVEIDHLVFGRFGVLVVETKGISGTVSGKGKKLVHQIGNSSFKLYNPQLQNKTHMDNVIHHLKKGGFGDIPVYGAVVFTDKDIQVSDDIGMKPAQFEKMYRKLEDVGCNQDVIYHYFQKLVVTNPIKKYFHKFNKKDWD